MTKDKARLLLLGTAGGASGGGGGYPEPTGTITITANGTGINVKDYAAADVAVPSSADPDKQAASLVLYCNGGGAHDATKIVAKPGGGSAPTDLSYAFAFCEKATQFDLSGLDLSAVTKIRGIFLNCTALTAGVLPAVAIEDLRDVFRDCANLVSADFTAVSVVDEYASFQLTNALYNCRKLVSVNLSGLDMEQCADMGYAFNNCVKLETITTDANTKFPDINLTTAFAGCSALTEQSMVNVFNALPTTMQERTISFVAAAYARLTAADKAIAENKGWTVAQR